MNKLTPCDERKSAQAILDAINVISLNSTEIAKYISYNHPTLQQDFMRICLVFIKEMSVKQSFDLRNAQSVKIAQKIAGCLEETDYFLARV